MRADSRRGKPLESQLTRQIESKLLITTKYVNAVPKNISKFDSLKHQQQFNRQYNLKFMSDRKRNKSLNKAMSTSKIISRQSKKEKIAIQAKKLIFEEQDFRQKYYDLNEYYLEQKKKWVEDAQAMLAYKETICDFLGKSNLKSTESLRRLKNDKLAESIKKIVQERRQWDEGQHILKEIMNILQVDRWEDIVHNLRTRVDRFRNLDECTFKIMELQSINKRIVTQFDERTGSIAREIEERARREKDKMKNQLEIIQNRNSILEQELNKQKQQFLKLVIDLEKIVDLENDHSPKWESGRSEVLQIRKIIVGLNSKLQDIEIQAEENMIRLLNSNKDMLKLQRLMNQLKDDMNLQIYEAQQKNQKYMLEIDQMNQQIGKLQIQVDLHKGEVTKLQNQRERRNGEIQDEHQLLSSSLGLNEANPPKIVIKVQENVREIAILKAQRQELKQTIIDKGIHLQAITKQLDQSNKAIVELKQTTKAALFQKQQYKFLLNNLRDQVTEMKKQFVDQKNRIVKQKDEEIIHSNKDILQSYAKLSDEHHELNTQLMVIKTSYEENKVDLACYKKQNENQQKLIAEREQELSKAKEECERYCKYMGEIQSQFKEVVDMSEVTSKKMTTMEQQQNESNTTIKHLKTKNTELEKNNNQLIQKSNELRMQVTKFTVDIKELRDQRCKLETTVVELRLEVIEKQSERTKVDEELKKLAKESKSYKLANQKLIGEINSVTRKLINYKSDWKKKIVSKLNQCKQTCHRVRQEQLIIKKVVREQIQDMATLISGRIDQISSMIVINSIQSHYQSEEEEATVQKEEIKKIQLCEVGVSCNLGLNKQMLKTKLQNILFQIKQLAQYKLKLQTLVTDQRQTSYQNDLLMNSFHVFISSQLPPAINIIPAVACQQSEPGQDHLEQQLEEVDSISQQNNNKAMIFEENLITQRDQEGENVNLILQLLIDEDTEIPSLPYWSKIETNFLAIKRKLNKKNVTLKLDISEIDFKEPNLTSPNSLSYLAQGDFFRRVNTDYEEDLKDAKEEKESSLLDKFNINEFLRKQNQKLKIQTFEMKEKLDWLQQKERENKIVIRELENKVAVMENASSTKGVAFHFKSFMDHLFNGTIEQLQQTSKIIMKMLHLTKEQIEKIDGYFSGRKKRKSGLFSGIFK